jgi:hypothetical protein
MRNNLKNKALLFGLIALAAIYTGSLLAPAQSQPHPSAESKGQACPNDDSGLKLPAGFAQRSSLTTLVTPAI